MNKEQGPTYKMFIDDERFPVIIEDWEIVRTSNQAKNLVLEKGLPIFISFDHDLGGDDTAIKFVVWLADHLLDNQLQLPCDFGFTVHSQNPIGTKNIYSYMYNIIKYIGEHE